MVDAGPGSALRSLRGDVSQIDLATKLGHTGRTTVANMEQGRTPISPDMARRIGEALGLDPAPLLTAIETPARPIEGASKLRRVALVDITPGPNARPRKPGALSWDEAIAEPDEPVPVERMPFDVSHVANIRIEDGCAVMMQAPAVRPMEGPVGAEYRFSLIFGECRLWAALLAGATHLEVSVHDVDEQTAAIMHRVENGAHAPLPALAEAEELSALLKAFPDPLDLARAVGRPVEEIRRRLALLKLCAPARDALALDATLEPVAVFWARHDETAQLAAWERAQVYAKAGPLRLTAQVRALFADLPIASARWDLADRTLRPAVDQKILRAAAGCSAVVSVEADPLRPCVGCPDRSDATGSLFPDDTAATCLRAACWDAKSAAHDARIVERARTKGVPVLEGDAAKRILPVYASSVPVESGFVDLDGESPVEGPGGKRLTWRLILPSTIAVGIETPLVVDQVLVDRDGKARELVSVERAARLTKQGSVEHPERAKPLAEWAKSVAAQRTVVREPAPLPEAKAPKAGGDARAKEEAKKTAQAHETIIGHVLSGSPMPGVLAGWTMRVVSSDAVCMVGEAIELFEGADQSFPTPAAAVKWAAGDTSRTESVIAALLAAELLHRGGELADMVTRAAPKKKVDEKRGAGEDLVHPKKRQNKGKASAADDSSAVAPDLGHPAKPACDCRPVPRKGPCKSTCASKLPAKGAGKIPDPPAPVLSAEQLEEIGGRCLAYIGKDGAHALDIAEACGEDEEPGTIPVVLEHLLNKGELVCDMPDRFYRLAPPLVEDAAAPGDPVRLDGSDLVDALRRTCPKCGAKSGYCVVKGGRLKSGYVHPERVSKPALDTPTDPSILQRAALAAAIATICAGGGRKLLQLRTGLKSSCPESSPADREAAITMALDQGRLAEQPGGKLVAVKA